MAQLFQKPTYAKVDRPPTCLAVSPDGALVAVGVFTDWKAPLVQVYSRASASWVGSYGVGVMCRGVAFGAGKLYYLTEKCDEKTTELHCVDLGTGQDTQECRYVHDFLIDGLAYSGESEHVAMQGNRLLVRDLKNERLALQLGSVSPTGKVCAEFLEQGKKIVVYGHRAAEAVIYNLKTGKAMACLPAPAPEGGQVRVSPSGRWLLLAANGRAGVYLYDLHSKKRFAPESFGDGCYVGRYEFSRDDSRLFALWRDRIVTHDLSSDACERGKPVEIECSNPTEFAHATAADVMVAGFRGRSFACVPLRYPSARGTARAGTRAGSRS